MSRDAVKSKKSVNELRSVEQSELTEAARSTAAELPNAAAEQVRIGANGSSAEITAQARDTLAQIRSRIETRVGQPALQMMQLPPYCHRASPLRRLDPVARH